jgi:hypothetical protein
MLRRRNRFQYQRVVMIAVAIMAQDDQIALPLEAEARVRPMMDFEPIVVPAPVAGVPGLLERQGPVPGANAP